jgi:16S rRNA (guanine966-N2)-methyltransferase
LFNVLEHAAWAPALEGARVIDLFAGSGALGLEALSRGAAFSLFVDSDAAARAAIAANLANLGCDAKATLASLDATRLPKNDGQPFDLAFLDPPYAAGAAQAALQALVAGGWLAPDALIVVETGADRPPPDATGLKRLDERTWGAARVVFLAA